jgi:hypothetical protein
LIFSQIQRSLQKHRRCNIPPSPTTPEDFIRLLLIEDNYSRFGQIAEHNFFSGLVDSPTGSHVVFVNAYVLSVCNTMRELAVNIDATFSVTPVMFYQTLIILVKWKERVNISLFHSKYFNQFDLKKMFFMFTEFSLGIHTNEKQESPIIRSSI